MELWKVLEFGLKERMDNDPSTMKVDDELISRILILAMLSPNRYFGRYFSYYSQKFVIYFVHKQEG